MATVRVRVTGLKAKGLRAADRGGTSDPFCVLKVGKESFKTEVVDKTLAPEWPTFECVFGLKEDLEAHDGIEVTLYDNDVMGKDTLGTVAMPFDWSAGAEAVSQWYPVFYKGNTFGTLHATLQMTGYSGAAPTAPSSLFEGAVATAVGKDGTVRNEAGGAAGVEESKASDGGAAPPAMPVTTTRPPNAINVTVVGARNLIAADRNGTSDPIVVLKCGKEKLETSRKDDTLEPKFEESFCFPCRDRNAELLVTAQNDNVFKNDFLGCVRLFVADHRHAPNTEKWYTLVDKSQHADKERGELCLSVSWTYVDDVPPAAMQVDAMDDAEDDGGSVVDDAEEEAKVEEAMKEAAEAAAKREADLRSMVIPTGDFQVQVHVIEVRGLKPEDPDGTADPVVYAEVNGKKKHTKVYHDTTEVVIDEVLFFTLPAMDKAKLERQEITVSVFDADTLSRNDLVGLFQFDLMQVYYEPNHEMWRQWVGLVDPDDTSDKGLQGYLKCTVVVLGPGDVAPLHTPEEEAKKDEGDDAQASSAKGGKAESLDALCLMPPSLTREVHFLVLSVFQATGLPCMDPSKLGLGSSGIDAFVQVEFAGNPKLRTRYRTVKGDGNLSVTWNEQLWIPLMTPTMSHTIELSVWDHDKLAPNDRVGTVFLRFDDIQRAGPDGIGPMWVNVYGAPEGISTGDNKNRMNREPEYATNWRGQLLIAAREDSDAKKKEPEEPHKKRTRTPPAAVKPPMAEFAVRALIVSGTDLPKAGAVRTGSLHVCVRVGTTELRCTPEKPQHGSVQWKALVEGTVHLPIDPAQMPDTFVYLCRGNKPSDRMSYARFPTSDLLQHGFTEPAKWIHLRRDAAVGAVDSDERPGSVLVRLGFGKPSDDDSDWRTDLESLDDLKPYELRAHVYQGRRIPAADDNGNVDPYAVLHFFGQERRTQSSERTTCPLWYETLHMDVFLPPLQYAPQVLLQVWDKDKFSKDDYIAEMRYSLASPETMVCHANELASTTLGDPQWIALHRPEDATPSEEHMGELLVSFQLVEKATPDQQVERIPASIVPATSDWFVEVVALGVRNMAAYKMQEIYLPFVEFDVGDRSRSGRVFSTSQSKTPSGPNANFLERILVPVKLPDNPLYAPSLNLTVRDTRLGGLLKPVVGTAAISLSDKLPWAPSFVAPGEQGHAITETAYNNKGSDKVTVKSAGGAGAAEGSSGAVGVAEGSSGAVEGSSGAAEGSSDAAAPAPNAGAAAGAGTAPPEEGGEVVDENTIDPSFVPDVAEVLTASGDKDLEHKLDTKKGEETVLEPEEKKYMKNRWVYQCGLEEVFKRSPFESYTIWRGQSVGRGSVAGVKLDSTLRDVGLFKGIIRVIKSAEDPPLFDLNRLLKANSYLVRVYALNALGVQPMDANNKSDPFLKLRLGDVKIDDSKRYLKETTNPGFYRVFELPATLPGASQLEIELWDYDRLSANDFIGKTVIDLEDRWFEQAWQQYGVENETRLRYRRKPVELRGFWNPTSATSQGTLRMWVDIMTDAQSRQYKPEKVEPPPPEPWELRMVVWRTEKVKAMDAITQMNDLYAKVWIEGMEPQETDIHWRSKRGRASWNWRVKYALDLPMKYPRMHIQLWDKDVLKYSDCVAEATFSLTKFLRRARKEKKRINMFNPAVENPDPAKPPPGGEAKAATAGAPAAEAMPAGPGVAMVAPQTKKPPMLAPGETQYCVICPPGTAPHVHHHAAPTEGPGYVAVSVAEALPAADTGAGVALVPAPAGAVESKAAPGGVVETKAAPGGAAEAKAPAGTVIESKPATGEGKEEDTDSDEFHEDDDVEVDEEEEDDEDDDSDDDVQNAKDTFASLKKMIGMEDQVHPKDGAWITMYRTEFKSGTRKRRKMGRVLLSIEAMPKDLAEKLPAGFGRSEPNANPILPEPTGRLKFSWNPFSLMTQCLGRSLCLKLCCCFLVLGVILASIFLAPFFSVVIPWFDSLGRVGYILGALIVVFLCGPPIAMFLRHKLCGGKKKKKKGKKSDIRGVGSEAWNRPAQQPEESSSCCGCCRRSSKPAARAASPRHNDLRKPLLANKV